MAERSAHIIGVPLDLGGNRRGVDMGPSAFRIAGLGERIAALGYAVSDKGDLPAPIPETQERRDEHKKYIRDIAKVCQKVYQTALSSLEIEMRLGNVPDRNGCTGIYRNSCYAFRHFGVIHYCFVRKQQSWHHDDFESVQPPRFIQRN